MTGHWWTHKDARRVIARAYSGKPMTDAEVSHLRAQAMGLLVGALDLDPDDAKRLRWLLSWLDDAKEEVS